MFIIEIQNQLTELFEVVDGADEQVDIGTVHAERGEVLNPIGQLLEHSDSTRPQGLQQTLIEIAHQLFLLELGKQPQ